MKSLLLLLDFIILSTATSVRLRGDYSSPYQGRVEVYHNGTWGTICDDYWGDDDATVICRMLNFRKGGKAFTAAHFGAGNGRIWLDNVNCTSDNTLRDISECRHRGWGTENCGHAEDAGVACTLIDIRLVNGSKEDNGRVEVYHNDAWGTICDDSWTSDNSRVVCRQLGYRDQLFHNSSGAYGKGTGAILMDDVDCSLGYIPDKIWDCSFDGWGVGNCGHSEDIGVACATNSVRLVNGSKRKRGRVEILQNDQWGTVCDNGFGKEEARAVCQMLRYRDGTPCSFFGAGTGTIHVDNLECPARQYKPRHALVLGNNKCAFDGWGHNSCSHMKDVGVWCVLRAKEIVLVDGTENSGRISVYDGDSFGSLCYGSLDVTNADVLCRSIGYRYGGKLFRNPNTRVNSITISTVQNLQCGGTETRLSSCDGTWGTYSCPFGQDIWIDCIASCEEGKYGHLCTRQCHCKIPGCSISSGRCSSEDCLPGWLGPSCSEECKNTTFGEDCLERCHCNTPGCHHETGVCNNQDAGCQDGWEGSSCDKACEEGKYGHQCTKQCHCKIPRCNISSGRCSNEDCLPGWLGPSCSEECKNTTFGKDCLERCHCKAPGCHHETGVCNNQNAGCQDGWEGSSCDKVFVADNMVYLIVIACLGVLLIGSVITNIGFYVTRKRKDETNRVYEDLHVQDLNERSGEYDIVRCSPQRLSGFVVEIYDSNILGPNRRLKHSRLCYNYTEAHVPGGELKTLACPTETVGRYIRISRKSAYLTLCEVIVEGKPVSCLDTTCQQLPAIRQCDGQSLEDIVQELNQLMPGCKHFRCFHISYS